MPHPRPSERPSFAQRDAYRDVLSDAFAQGRLNDQEFSRRIDRAASATVLGDLEELVADLPRGDLPVPAEQIRRPAREDEERTQRTSAARRGLALTAAVLVGGLAGFLGGSAAIYPNAGASGADDGVAADTGAAADDSAADSNAADDSAADDRAADNSAADDSAADDSPEARAFSDISYGAAQRAAQLAADHGDLTGLRVTGTSASVHVPTEAGTTYDVVTLAQDGTITTEPGGTYGEDEADVQLPGNRIDGEELAAMILAAPEIYATTTGTTGHPATALDVRAPAVDYAGVAPDAPVVRVQLGLDEYGGGGGAVVWTLDGSRVLEVVG
jgi:hypothetical protein